MEFVYDDKKNLHVDVYQAESDHKSTGSLKDIIFYIHGGAWTVGNKKYAKYPLKVLSEHNTVSFAVEYRQGSLNNDQFDSILLILMFVLLLLALTSRNNVQMITILIILSFSVLFLFAISVTIPTENVRHPDHIYDVAKAFRWVYDHADQFGGNKDRIFIMGHSAGGGLATLLSTNHSYLRKYGLEPNVIKGTISVSGVYSDRRMQETLLGRQLLVSNFGRRHAYFDAFSIYNVDHHTPPHLLINAKDDISLKPHTRDYVDVLRVHGIYNKTVYVNNRNHFNIMRDWNDKNENTLRPILQFIREINEHLQENQ